MASGLFLILRGSGAVPSLLGTAFADTWAKYTQKCTCTIHICINIHTYMYIVYVYIYTRECAWVYTSFSWQLLPLQAADTSARHAVHLNVILKYRLTMAIQQQKHKRAHASPFETSTANKRYPNHPLSLTLSLHSAIVTGAARWAFFAQIKSKEQKWFLPYAVQKELLLLRMRDDILTTSSAFTHTHRCTNTYTHTPTHTHHKHFCCTCCYAYCKSVKCRRQSVEIYTHI